MHETPIDPLVEHHPPHHGGELLRPAEVCARLQVSRAWVYRAAADGRIPSLRLGGPEGPLRFEPAALEAWLERCRAAWRPARQQRRHAAPRLLGHAQHPRVTRGPDPRLGVGHALRAELLLQVPVVVAGDLHRTVPELRAHELE